MKNDIQSLVNQGVLQVNSLVKNEEVSIIEPCFDLSNPIEIPYQRVDVAQLNNCVSHVVICMPAYFPYESTKVVSWEYEITDTEKELEEGDEESFEVVDVTNIAKTGRMTQSGRIYTPDSK